MKARPIASAAVLIPAALALACLASAVGPERARAAGGPIISLAVPGGEGIERLDGKLRYVTVDGYGHNTILGRITEGDGVLKRSNTIAPGDGTFGIPQVARDGSPAGLSADGSTLVMIRVDGPINRGELRVIETGGLTTQGVIRLDGQYSFDAISPDGDTAYVVHYPRVGDYSRYVVRELNLKNGELAPGAIAASDVGHVDGTMRGMALSRVNSPDGRLAYTLYDGGNEMPFVHVLDSERGVAMCVFLEDLAGLGPRERDNLGIAIDETGGQLGIGPVAAEGAIETELLVATDDYAITDPGSTPPEADSAGSTPMLLGAVGVALLAFIGGAARFGRRGRAA